MLTKGTFQGGICLSFPDGSFVKVPLYAAAISDDYAVAKLITLSISSKLSTLPLRKSPVTAASQRTE